MRILVLIISLLISEIQFSYSKDLNKSFDWIKVKPMANLGNVDWSLLPNGFSKSMIDLLISNSYMSNNESITIFNIENNFYALFPCRLDVFIWLDQKWENIYEGYSAGFNCLPFFFEKEGVLFSYGRYGYWHAHSELISFDTKAGSWDNVTAYNMPINYGGPASYLSEKGLITFMGQYIHQSSGINVFEKDGYYFDFEKEKWFPLDVIIDNQPMDSNWMVPSFDLKDYGIKLYNYKAELGLLVLDKKDFSLHFKKIDFSSISDYSVSYAKGNEIWFFNSSSDKVHLDLDRDFHKSFRKIGEINLMNGTPYKFSWKDLVIGLLGISLLSLVFGIKRIRKKRSSELQEIQPWDVPTQEQPVNKEQNYEDLARIINSITLYINQAFEVDEFDEILGIHTIENIDYRRVKRNRLIKTVNEYSILNFGKKLIERSRSDIDKRVMLYRILE